jgi:hypothetical protein
MSHAEEDEAEGRETPAGSRHKAASKNPGKGSAAKKGTGGKPAAKDADEPKERVDRVRYEPDTEPPLSGGTSQIFTR